MTYRVVQVTEDHLEAAGDGGAAVSVVSTAAFAGAQQAVAQVCIEQTGLKHREKQKNYAVSALPTCLSYFYFCLSIGCHPEPFQ